ncbi:MAG TPA: hypothetical protein VF884_07220 [Nitrososphaeraceae archaeon]
MGRLAGFSLLRSMIEISVLRELLKLQNSPDYRNKTVKTRNDYPLSVNAVCKAIDSNKIPNKITTIPTT